MSKPERWTVIANPASAAGKTRKTASDIVDVLRRSCSHDVELLLTQAPGHASELVEKAVEGGTDCIISIGGDGTHHEVLNGFLNQDGRARNPQCAFGILPSGTGGDFARLLYSTRDPRAAAKKLVNGTPRLIDVGSCHYTTDDGQEEHRFFLNIGSFGMGGLVVRLANDGPKFIGAKGTFLLGVARSVLKYRNSRVRMSVNGTSVGSRTIRLVSVSNGQYFGGGMKAAPSARLDDGIFDVVSLGDVPLSRLVRLIGRVYKGTHVSDPDVDFIYGSSVEARPDDGQEEPVLVELDGEGVGKLPARFELLEQRIRLLFPADAPIENS